MNSTQVVEMSVSTNNSASQDYLYTNLDDQPEPTTNTDSPELRPFIVLKMQNKETEGTFVILLLPPSSSFSVSFNKCDPGTPLTNFNDGGWGGGEEGQQRFIFSTPKNRNFRICLPKKNHRTAILAYPKKALNPFFTTQKNPSIFFS